MSEEKKVHLNFEDKESQIFPYESPVTLEILRHYKKLELSPAGKALKGYQYGRDETNLSD